MASLLCGTMPTSTVEERVKVVYSAVANVCQRKELQINSARAINIKQLSNNLVSSLQAPGTQELFKVFASKLYLQLCSPLNQTEPITMAKLRERMWVQYMLTNKPLYYQNFGVNFYNRLLMAMLV